MDNDNIMIKMRADGKYIAVATYSRGRGHRGPFLLYLEELEEWCRDGFEWHLRDEYCGNSISLSAGDRFVNAEIWWRADDTENAPGFFQRYSVPLESLRSLLSVGTSFRYLYALSGKGDDTP